MGTGLMLAATSCKKLVDVEPKTTVGIANMYRNVFDADAAVIGVYGKVMKLAKPYVLLNELRGDLMDITNNADANLRQLSEQTATVNNPYIDPQPFYEVIVNCNDVLYNFQKMVSASKLKQDEFNQRYSDIASIRSWVYLQLGIHYGRIPYVTKPIAQVSELKDTSNFPMLSLPVLIDSLVAFTEQLPFTDDYPSGTTLQTTVDGYTTNKFFINKNVLMGDLYLWQGQYDKAADRYKRVMEINGPVGNSELWYNQYRISSFGNAGITYSRTLDFNSLVYTNGWRYLFERPVTDNEFNWEMIWNLPFDKNFAPENPFIDLFSPNGGSYLVKPSQQAMDYWNAQTQVYTYTAATPTAGEVLRDNFPFDSRANFTYRMINGQPVIMKYLYNYLGTDNQPISLLNKTGKWFLLRAANLHLHYSEAANRAGKYKVAYALVNKGIGYTYDPYPGNSVSANRDVTNYQQTFLPWPYDFDARGGQAPAYRNTWYRNMGIRGRANLKPVTLPATDSVTNVENMIITEDALELAYEGERWPDLLRVAMRRNDPSFIADKVYDKLRKSGLSAGAASAARTKLMNRDWFLPFKLN
ncbi:MAG: RagB/SusD family protein [Bacteroidetes bacterium]|nr:RagB/SusD family protein [Bacteroidota bacterium]